ncbi:MFS transporter [Flavonifractor hominis]|uniref:MFS transporter n=1 Tax=Flavonifractor hominis TaxID=3133178 RepID=A0ABV1ETS3_9FIRM
MNQLSEEQRQSQLLRNVLFAFFVSGAASQPLGSFIPFLRETYGFSYDLSGVLLACQSTGNLVAVLLAGLLPVYLGRRRSVLLTGVWMAVGYLIFASGLGTPALLVAACLMTGLARGGNSNFANTMISTLPGPVATRGYNLLHGSFAMGALLSPLVLVFCAGRWPVMGWRIVAGLLCLLCLSQLAVYAKMPLPAEPEKKGLKAVDYSFLRVKQFWLGAAMLFCYISTEYAIVGWLVTYFQDIGVLSPDQSQMMNSLLWLVIFIGRMIGAAITNKVSRSKLLLVDGVGLFAFFLLMFFSRSVAPIVIGLVGVGLFMATIYPTAFAFGSDCIKGNDLGCSIMIFTGSAGGIITPAMVGFVAEQAGIEAGMSLIVAFTGLLLLSIILSTFSVRKSHSLRKKGE